MRPELLAAGLDGAKRQAAEGPVEAIPRRLLFESKLELLAFGLEDGRPDSLRLSARKPAARVSSLARSDTAPRWRASPQWLAQSVLLGTWARFAKTALPRRCYD